MLTDKSILITGGTGSFGKAFVRTVLERYPGIRRLVIYSRDELKQFEMQQRYSTAQHPGLRYFLGDVRDEVPSLQREMLRSALAIDPKRSAPCQRHRSAGRELERSAPIGRRFDALPRFDRSGGLQRRLTLIASQRCTLAPRRRVDRNRC